MSLSNPFHIVQWHPSPRAQEKSQPGVARLSLPVGPPGLIAPGIDLSGPAPSQWLIMIGWDGTNYMDLVKTPGGSCIKNSKSLYYIIYIYIVWRCWELCVLYGCSSPRCCHRFRISLAMFDASLDRLKVLVNGAGLSGFLRCACYQFDGRAIRGHSSNCLMADTTEWTVCRHVQTNSIQFTYHCLSDSGHFTTLAGHLETLVI